eukprot:gene14430-20436_t
MRAAGYNSSQQYGYAGPPIPNLPGHSQYLPVADARKRQTLKIVDGKQEVAEQPVSDRNSDRNYYFNEPEYQQQLQEYNAVQRPPLQDLGTNQGAGDKKWGVYNTRWTGVKTPGWLLHDKKVDNNPSEKSRVRRCHIRAFLEDDSVDIIEPKEPNSGLKQGTYLNRHKVKLLDGSILKWDMMRVGDTVTVYSRPFHIVGCDKATRDFLAEQNVFMPEDRPLPDGAYDTLLKVKEATTGLPLPTREKGENDPFYYRWPLGPGSVFHNEVDVRWAQFAHLDRKDNTIEVAEVINRNSGRDPFPLMLRRCKLPKTPNVPPIGV